MPSTMAGLDTGFPDVNGDGSIEEKLGKVSDYLHILLENLKFLMSNLNTENFNEAGLKDITAPVYKSIGDVSDSLLKVALTAEGAAITASNAEGAAATAQITAEGASITAQSAAGAAASLQFTVDGLDVTTSGGTTFISGDHIRSGTIEGVVLISMEPQMETSVKIENGGITLGQGTLHYFASFHYDAENGRAYLYSVPGTPIKIEAGGNMSIDAHNTVYIGTGDGGCNVHIGAAGTSNRIDLWGDVYINGVLQA